MTRAPLNTQPLSLLPPTATFTHTENACVYVHMCHGQQPLTCNTALRQKEITDKGDERDMFLRKKESVEGPKNILVSSSYATNVMK